MYFHFAFSTKLQITPLSFINLKPTPMLKKYFLFIISFFFISISFGQILYEDFSSVTPNENYSRIGWTNISEEGTRVFQGKDYGPEYKYYVPM